MMFNTFKAIIKTGLPPDFWSKHITEKLEIRFTHEGKERSFMISLDDGKLLIESGHGGITQKAIKSSTIKIWNE